MLYLIIILLALAFFSLIFSIIKRLIKFAFFAGAFTVILALMLIVLIL